MGHMYNRKRQRAVLTGLAPWAARGMAKPGRRYLRATKRYPKNRYSMNRRTGGVSGIENKWVGYSKAATAVGVNWVTRNPTTTDCISAVGIGDSPNQRDGRVYHINSVHIRGAVAQPIAEAQGAPVDDSIVRILLIWDKQTNGSQLTATDVMDNTGTSDYLGFRNLDNTTRFIVLADKTVRLETSLNAQNEGAANAFTTSGLKRPFMINKVFKKPIKVICPLTTAVVGAISDNSLHIVACASNASMTIEYQSRVRFYK